MATHTFSVDNATVEIEDGNQSQQVRFNNALVSEIKSTWRPRVTIVHRFLAGDPLRQFEVRTFQGLGRLPYVVTRDGELVASAPPSVWVPVLVGLALLVNGIDFAFDRKTNDLISVIIFTLFLTFPLIQWSAWWRAKRAVTRVAGASV
jgi:hypothetical protein